MGSSIEDASAACLAAEASIGYRFLDASLLRRALTHSSASSGENYEKLEFLGDAVIELLARELLIRVFPGEEEGKLTRRKRFLVSSRSLASRGRRMGLDACVITGEGTGGRTIPMSMAADVVEAVCGAVFQEAGLDGARPVILKAILEPLLETGSDPGADPRSRLQEMCQAAGWSPPEYRVSRSGGTEHAPVFSAEVFLGGRRGGSGSGATKKEAQSAAAENALGRIEGGGKDGLLSLG